MNILKENVVASLSISKKVFDTQGPFHWHPRTELCYMCEGTCDFYINGTHYTGHKGDLIAFKSGDIHCFTPVNSVCVAYVCLFEPSLLCLKNMRMPLLRPFTDASELEGKGLDVKLVSIFEDMLAEKSGGDAYSDVIMTSQAAMLYALLARDLEDNFHIGTGDMRRFGAFQKALDYIYENYARDITLSDVAGVINYGESTVSGMFSEYSGTNFKTYLNNIRVNRAIEMLVSSSGNVTEVAMRCGFNNIRTFNGAFKKITGMTPTDLKNERVGGNPDGD